jgi:hypothetical protein
MVQFAMEIIDSVEVDVYKLHKFCKWALDNGAHTWEDAFKVGGFSSLQIHFHGEYDRKYSLSEKEYTLFSLRWIE